MAKNQKLEELKKKYEGDDHLWKVSLRNLGGRPAMFKKPIELYEKAIDYFNWVDEHPWQDKAASNGRSENIISGKNAGQTNHVNQHVKVNRLPYTLYGFCAFAGISSKWADFKRAYQEKEGFSEVIQWIEYVVTSEQVNGAMIHRYDSNLVARLNSIADTIKQEITGKDGSDFVLPKLTEEDFEKARKLNDQNG